MSKHLCKDTDKEGFDFDNNQVILSHFEINLTANKPLKNKYQSCYTVH